MIKTTEALDRKKLKVLNNSEFQKQGGNFEACAYVSARMIYYLLYPF